jgi:flagellar protein FliO/FliZ
MEFTDYLRFFIALLFVVGLIGLLALAARRFGMAPRVVKDANRRGRLAIVDLAPLDGRRRLVLLRRDNVEHLVILSPTGETVVETGIAVPRGA